MKSLEASNHPINFSSHIRNTLIPNSLISLFSKLLPVDGSAGSIFLQQPMDHPHRIVGRLNDILPKPVKELLSGLKLIPTQNYLDGLLTIHQEEIQGKVYFNGLKGYYTETEQQTKLGLLAEVESRCASIAFKILKKYGIEHLLVSTSELEKVANQWVSDENREWNDLIDYMLEAYPGYVNYFAAFQANSPSGDKALLGLVTKHEEALLDFAKLEKDSNENSVTPLKQFLSDTDDIILSDTY